MVNHFASLLGNLPLVSQKLVAIPYTLGDTDPIIDEMFSSDDGASLFSLEDAYVDLRYTRTVSPFSARDYSRLTLPFELEQFYKILFPETSSLYYKHFLLFTYLKLLNSTTLNPLTLIYDSRITYDLSNSKDYFRFRKNSATFSSSSNYNLTVTGHLKATETTEFYLNNFVVSQIDNSSSIYIFSTTEGKYYKEGSSPSRSSENMEVQLVLSDPSGVSNKINIGNTGLSFYLTGPFTSQEQGFLTSAKKYWSFTAETCFTFNLPEKLKELEGKYHIVENMLSYPAASDTSSYENIWQTHFNEVYKFSGLLLAYVARVHRLWLHQTSQ